jgi:ribosomal protein S18 acetylase RimI-like enzyme
MYIHDVAVDPQHHKQGIAQSLVDAIFARASELQLHKYELVAVQNSAEFWKRNGFSEHGIAGTEYGDGAVKMMKN